MRGRPLIIDWHESVDELQTRMTNERNGHRRARLNAMLMLRKERPISEVCHAVGVDYRTIQRWLSWYRQAGLEAVLNRTPGHAAPGRPSHLNREQIEELLTKANTGDFRTVWDAVRWTQDQFGVEYTYTGMHALLNRNQRDRPY
jgi:transposase